MKNEQKKNDHACKNSNLKKMFCFVAAAIGVVLAVDVTLLFVVIGAVVVVVLVAAVVVLLVVVDVQAMP